MGARLSAREPDVLGQALRQAQRSVPRPRTAVEDLPPTRLLRVRSDSLRISARAVRVQRARRARARRRAAGGTPLRSGARRAVGRLRAPGAASARAAGADDDSPSALDRSAFEPCARPHVRRAEGLAHVLSGSLAGARRAPTGRGVDLERRVEARDRTRFPRASRAHPRRAQRRRVRRAGRSARAARAPRAALRRALRRPEQGPRVPAARARAAPAGRQPARARRFPGLHATREDAARPAARVTRAVFGQGVRGRARARVPRRERRRAAVALRGLRPTGDRSAGRRHAGGRRPRRRLVRGDRRRTRRPARSAARSAGAREGNRGDTRALGRRTRRGARRPPPARVTLRLAPHRRAYPRGVSSGDLRMEGPQASAARERAARRSRAEPGWPADARGPGPRR